MKNDYEIRGDVTAIFLNSKKHGMVETLISTRKLQIANEFPGTWYVAYSDITKSLYVRGNIPMGNGKRKTGSLHRWITNATDALVVDHIDHDTLNNTDDNLRLLTTAENGQNRKGTQRNNSSGIRGVHWNNENKKWRAQVRLNRKTHRLGYFDNLEDARIAVESAREKLMPFSEEAYRNAN